MIQTTCRQTNGAFQHAAARRRLAGLGLCASRANGSFNTQPPEGGWYISVFTIFQYLLFQHAAARRRLGSEESKAYYHARFQHAAARRRLGFFKQVDDWRE